MKKLLTFASLLTFGVLFWQDILSITEVCVFFILGTASLIVTPFLLILTNIISSVIIESQFVSMIGPKGKRAIEILFYVPGAKKNHK